MLFEAVWEFELPPAAKGAAAPVWGVTPFGNPHAGAAAPICDRMALIV